MQNTVNQEALATCTTEAWYTLAKILKPEDFVPYLALTSAIFADSWSRFEEKAKSAAKKTLTLIVVGQPFREHLTALASFKDINDLKSLQQAITKLTPKLLIGQKLELLASRILDINATVSQLAISEAIELISDHDLFCPLITGDAFDPSVGSLIKALHTVAGREGEVYESTRLATYRCLGLIGAIDPDRFEIPRDDENPKITFCDFDDDTHSSAFAVHLIINVLAPIFPKTSDIKFQSQLAFALQELLRFCGFSESLIAVEHGNPVSARARILWGKIPGDVRATVAPLLGSKYIIEGRIDIPTIHPIYPSVSTYKEWVQKFASYLISQARGKNASSIFQPFQALLASADVQVLIFLLPHLVLEFLSDDSAERFTKIRDEIIAVVEDQVNPQANHSNDMRLLCAQVGFSFSRGQDTFINTIHR
jgi:serine/threonine-protein kinase ATR